MGVEHSSDLTPVKDLQMTLKSSSDIVDCVHDKLAVIVMFLTNLL